MDSQTLMVIAVCLIIGIGLFFALRAVVLWYFGINDIIKELQLIRKQLAEKKQ